MLKSLFSGVAGLQSHQIAMDVESNNIANVNTVGYKYSRANFSDLLAQTKGIATAPQGTLGGQNPVQVGLGSTVSSMTRIFSQGSIQNSDKNTDIAIQGDGFYVVSPDGGNTYKYTRAGDFKFDAAGNFVDNNGFVLQGWLRDEAAGKVDISAPMTSINIAPGLTTPASPTKEITVKANLNSGPYIESMSSAFAVPSGAPVPPFTTTTPAIDPSGNPIESGDMGVMFNEVGEAFSLQTGQGIWASFLNSQVNGVNVINGSSTSSFSGLMLADAGVPGVADYTFDMVVDGLTISFLDPDSATTADENGAYYASQINAQLIAGGKSQITASYDSTTDTLTVASSRNTPVVITVNNPGDSTLATPPALAANPNELDIEFTLDNGTKQRVFTTGATGQETDDQNGVRYVSAINAKTSITGVSASYSIATKLITLVNTNGDGAASHNITVDALGIDNSGITAVGTTVTDTTAYRYQYSPTASSSLVGTDKTFTSIANLREALELQAREPVAGLNDNNISISVNADGKFEISNPGGGTNEYATNLNITGINASGVIGGGIIDNTRFTRNMEALNSSIPVASTGKAYSQSFNVATHSSSIDIFDSLGSKHTVRVDFRKVEVDVATGSTWDMLITVPTPGTIDLTFPYNEKKGQIIFNNDGSQATSTPPSIDFTGNNGSAPAQQVLLNFGTANSFDGMTSFDSKSSTSNISQDGFTGGDLVGIRIDQSGTLVGSFSNGRSFGLAQIGMAKFTNNEGLSTEGGNVYSQSANSGEPILGTAATAGRGFIQSAALEASNVDLSRALTQLIIIQRGFQANGKTITTSDQMLQTLIGLKN